MSAVDQDQSIDIIICESINLHSISKSRKNSLILDCLLGIQHNTVNYQLIFFPNKYLLGIIEQDYCQLSNNAVNSFINNERFLGSKHGV